MDTQGKLKDPELRRTRRKVQLTLAGFILLMIAALTVNVHLATRLGAVYTPMLHTLAHAKLDLTRAHLWLEEMLTGTEEADADRVFRLIGSAEGAAEKLLAGEQVHVLPGAPPVSGELAAPVQELHARIESLRELAALRWELREDRGSLLELDRRYDALYAQVIGLADGIEDQLEQKINDDLAVFQGVQAALIVACLVLLAYGTWLTSRHITRLGVELENRRFTEEQLTRSREAALSARDEAKAASAAKDLFLAKISHEVRTPINAAMGMVTLLGDTDLDATQWEFVQAIDSEMNDLREIVDDLLDFSSIEAGRVNLSPAPFDLRRVVAEAADHAVSLAAGRDVLVDALMPHDFPAKVVGDPVRVRQVLINLLRNAVKFTERGRILLELEGRSSGHGGYVDAMISVHDTGIGIPAESLDTIFTAFSQGDESTARRYGGTGLGLAIARELVELMSGNIGVDSIEGEGSRFWCQLPLRVAAPASGASPQPGSRLLLADLDDEVSGRTMALVGSLGVPVDIFTDGHDAVARLEELGRDNPYTLCVVSDRLTDLSVDGFLSSLPAAAAESGMTVWVMSSGAVVGDTERLHRLGADGAFTRCQRALMLPALLAGEEVSGRLGSQTRRNGDLPAASVEVLLVDDHRVTQIAARHMLESLGCRVEVAGNGAQALERWAARDYGVIFMDWHMPDMDGLEVTRAIRRAEMRDGRQRPVIVAMTASAMNDDRRRCLDAGMDDYISKPVTRDALRRVLRAAGDRNRNRASA